MEVTPNGGRKRNITKAYNILILKKMTEIQNVVIGIMDF